MLSLKQMRYITFGAAMLLVLLLVVAPIPTTSSTKRQVYHDGSNNVLHTNNAKRLPLSFTFNLGQFSQEVKFLAQTSVGSLTLTDDGATLLIGTQGEASKLNQIDRLENVSAVTHAAVTSTVLHYQLISANPRPNIVGVDELPGKSNYFLGSNPKNWHTNVPTYAKVEYQNVYPGTNLMWYGNEAGLEYDFILQAGADPSTIHLKITGAENITPKGSELVLHTTAGDLRQTAPHIYQDTPTGRHDVSGGYTLTADGEIGFNVAAYDHNRPLVIDPFLDYSSYFNGGTPYSVATDNAGSIYITGFSFMETLPIVNPIQPHIAGYVDAFITKIDATGQSVVYSTYLGGNDEDIGNGIAVDSNGFAYIVGTTNSHDFPLVNPADNQVGQEDAFVAKLSPAGNSLIYSTYLGGASWENGFAIALDRLANAYVTGRTMADDFPTFNPLQPTRRSELYTDAFVTKFNPSGAMVFSTYLGGNSEDIGWDIAVDERGSTYVTGQTDSTDFPTSNPLEPNLHSYAPDVFVTKINPSGTALEYSTYLGGSSSEEGYKVKVDSDNQAIVYGRTYSPDFPTQNPIQPQIASLGFADTFITKLNSSGTDIIYSTYFGGTQEEFPFDMVVSHTGEVYFTGQTDSTDYPRYNLNLPYYNPDNYGAFLTKFTITGQLGYSGYFGGVYGAAGTGISLDDAGNIYIVGIVTEGEPNFPLVNPLEPVNDGSNAFFLKIDAAIYTPTPTPTLAPYEFYDVPVGSIWHDYVHYLAEHGIVSGIRPGYYAPNQNTTRAQFAKMIVLGSGLPLTTPSTPSFTDVPPNYFAYPFIETAYAAELINGYSAAQCADVGRAYPCFGPNDQITRAQLVVITVASRRWELLTPTQPTFSDVPAGAFAYQQIETAVNRGIINGYVDNTSYHPCADAGVASPCFRPRNFGTRGQLSKILYNTIIYPTETPSPTNTATPVPSATPTDTSTPMLPSPTSTQLPAETATPLPLTETATPLSVTETATPLPPTGTATLLPSVTPTL